MDEEIPSGRQSTRPVQGLWLRQRDTLVHVLKQCGDDLSCENVMRRATSMRDVEDPRLLRGIRIDTSAYAYFPLEQLQLTCFDGRRWVRFGDAMSR